MGGADVDTFCTSSAIIGGNFGLREEWKGGNDFADEEERANFRVNQASIFTDPTEAGILSVGFFEDWGGIAADFGAGRREFLVDEVGKFMEHFFNDQVIIDVTGISRDLEILRVSFWIGLVIIEATRDNGFSFWKKLFGILFKREVIFEVGHFAME